MHDQVCMCVNRPWTFRARPTPDAEIMSLLLFGVKNVLYKGAWVA